MLPIGNYEAVATPVETEDGPVYAQFGETKTGKQQVAITFEILASEYAGQRITWFGYFTPNAAERTVQSLRYCGFRGNDISQAPTQALTSRVQLAIEHDEYNGRTSTKVRWVNRPSSGGMVLAKPYDKKAMRDLAEQLKATVAIVPEEAPVGKSGDDSLF